MIRLLKIILGIVFEDRASVRFAIGVLFGLSFSISVILATIGIMDGFEATLRMGLKKTNGDLIVYSNNGFFELDQKTQNTFEELQITQMTPLLQTEGFVLANEVSKGALIKGIQPEIFSIVTGLHINVADRQIALGKEIAKQLGVKIGDQVVLGLANGNKALNGLPQLERYQVSQIVTHGIYQKDLRLVYMSLSTLQNLMGVSQKYNLISLNIPTILQSKSHSEQVQSIQKKLMNKLGIDFTVRAYWQEYSTLIEAVQVEKVMIGIILQVVVVISIFNVLAFIYFINEKRAKEIFLFKALGLSQKVLTRIWLSFVMILWAFGCLLSVGMVKFFDWQLGNWSLFQLPGDIYYLGKLSISLSWQNYLLVFLLALLWMLVLSIVGLYRLKRRSILQGLRKEFS